MEVMEQLTMIEPLTPHQMAGRLANKKAIQDYMFAGKAIITIRNIADGTRYTYKIKKSKTNPSKFYVYNLRGPSYAKMGLISGDKEYYLPFDWKEKVQMARRNFAALYPGKPFPEKLYTQQHMPPSLRMFIRFLTWYKSDVEKMQNHEIWHEGVCGKCGRKLTVPSSIDRGLGDICATIIDRHDRNA